ncbi:MurR/RpiR family transcriptional regulator [Chelatococcus daeguensis]|uniref:Transcriptional regulator n=1 Tax=Chelatococcus daeguensis TaxID=444444 RepID=A0AAC9JWH3_9HYPH|nr:MurR/RpiR family transcriptional regulator [Chelatococcus daeguensis]APF38567.1 transcriptional regulator [Chelatococcus daeguensis]KZE34438.1 transcriptional regulator [Chelatococcus daeguensis]MBM3083285.1 MurR/RpiR family transcriptional regulator [Chelatococcus daeguensis]
MATAFDEPSIAQRIARAVLSPSHRRIADYVLDHPLRVAAMPIDELASIVGVSVATANRFARALGFDGYAQFRTALVLGFETALAPVEKLRGKPEKPASAADILAATLSETAHNIDRTRQGLDTEACKRAVAAILGARRVFILGLGSSVWLAGLLLRKLELFCDQVQLLASMEGSSHAARILHRVKPGDLVIAIAFPRYLSDTLLLTRRAREAGADVLALTESPGSPLASLATIALFAHGESQFFANCEASSLALIEALSSAVAHASGRSVEAAAELAEAVLPWLHGNHAGALRPSSAWDRQAPSPSTPRRGPKPRQGR